MSNGNVCKTSMKFGISDTYLFSAVLIDNSNLELSGYNLI